VRRFVNRETAVKAYRGLIEPCLNYRCPVWDGIGSEHTPKPHTDYLKRSLSYDGAVLWNSLPTELRSAQSISAFKRGLECWLA
jgi:hypothetical protein